jgi:alpha-mannosidase
MYIHMRPQSNELELPSDLYRWRGVDGSEIVGYRIAVGLYHTEPDNIEERLSSAVEMAIKLGRDVPVFWGLGNHGGGATRKDLARIDAFIANESRVEIIHSTPDRLHEALRDAAENAPVVEGVLQRAFTGCYTSLSRIKRGEKKSRALMTQTEALCAAAWWTKGMNYPKQELAAVWEDHLFNDFHDILPGSCTEPAEQDALELYGRAAQTARALRLGAAVAFNNGPVEQLYLPLTVLNANPSCARSPIEAEFMLDYRPRLTGDWHIRLFGSDGTEITCQEEQPESLLPFNGWRRKISFVDDIPSLGAANYRIEVFEGKRHDEAATPAISHEIGKNGLVTQIDAGDGCQCLAGALFQPLVIEDDGDSWGADRWDYRRVVGRFEPQGEPVVVESGPIRTITQSVFTYNHSKLVLDTISYADWPVLEFRMRVHWNEERKMLKLAVPTVFRSNKILCEVPGGTIFRPADGQEHTHGGWFMLQGPDGALAVINNGQHGFDLKDGEVRISVLRSSPYCHEKGFDLGRSREWKYADQGVHDVRFLVTAGNPRHVLASLPGLSEWLNAPPATYTHLPIGSYGSAASDSAIKDLLSIVPRNVQLTACKQSWDGEALIVRLQEMSGKETAADVRLRQPETSLRLIFRPFEIKTIRFDRPGEWREVNLIEEVSQC